MATETLEPQDAKSVHRQIDANVERLEKAFERIAAELAEQSGDMSELANALLKETDELLLKDKAL